MRTAIGGYTLDTKHRVGYWYLNAGEIARQVEVLPDAIVDVTADGTPVGVEFFGVDTVFDMAGMFSQLLAKARF